MKRVLMARSVVWTDCENCDTEVWFPLYPMAPEHRLKETVRATYGAAGLFWSTQIMNGLRKTGKIKMREADSSYET